MAKSTKFRDPNLQLVVLGGLWIAGLLKKPKAEPKPAVDKMVKKVRSELLAIDLPANVLARLDYLPWNGSPVFQMVWPGWTGDTRDFAIQSLDGIEACSNLNDLLIDGGVAFTDLTPLASLKKLTSVVLTGKELTNLEPLLELPQLKKVFVQRKKSARNDKVLAALTAKGVAVTSS